jgi:streptogramin lyase
VLATYDLGISPSGIVVAGDHVWVEDHAQTNAVFALDPSTGDSVMTVHVSRPCDVVTTGGQLWIADYGAGEVLAVDLATGEVAERIGNLDGPCGLQVLGGSLWFTVDDGIARLDIASGVVTTADLGGGAFPGSGKPLWASRFGGAEVGRVDPETGEVRRWITLPGGSTEDKPIAAGFGSVWVGHGLAGRLYRLDPRTGEIQAEIEVASPSRLLVTDDSVWLTSFATGAVERVDPATNQVIYHAELGGTPNGITQGFGAIWVGETTLRHLYKIDPAATSVQS